MVWKCGNRFCRKLALFHFRIFFYLWRNFCHCIYLVLNRKNISYLNSCRQTVSQIFMLVSFLWHSTTFHDCHVSFHQMRSNSFFLLPFFLLGSFPFLFAFQFLLLFPRASFALGHKVLVLRFASCFCWICLLFVRNCVECNNRGKNVNEIGLVFLEPMVLLITNYS